MWGSRKGRNTVCSQHFAEAIFKTFNSWSAYYYSKLFWDKIFILEGCQCQGIEGGSRMGPRAGLELWPAASGPATGWWLQLGLAGTVKAPPGGWCPQDQLCAQEQALAVWRLLGLHVEESSELSLACSGWREPTNGKWAFREQKLCLSLAVRCYCGVMDDLLGVSSTSALSQAWYCAEVAEGWAACLGLGKAAV